MIKQSDDLILKTIARVMAPFFMVYGAYVLMHGHYSPGGGFQAGVVTGAVLILLTVSMGSAYVQSKVSNKTIFILAGIGVFIYAGIGALCLVMGGNLLDYGALAPLLGMAVADARSYGILGVEVGVTITVGTVMYAIFVTLVTGDENAPVQQSHEGV